MSASAREILQSAIIDRSIPEPNTGCWLWLLALSRDGYGKFYVGGEGETRITAQRASYMAFKGNIPSGYQIDHLCRVRCCVNPAHLEAVTPQINVLRGTSPIAQQAAQTHCSRGHELTGDNLYVFEGDGHRRCKTCTALKSREHYERNRQKIIARTAARRLRATVSRLEKREGRP